MTAEPHLFIDQYPDLSRAPVPVEPYVSDAYFERERSGIFRTCWLNVGRESDIATAGEYFVRDIAITGASVLVVRGNDGIVRAFHNMCSHRGNPVTWKTRGKCRFFTCQFHGWAYDTEGALAHVSDRDWFFDLDPAENGLTPIHCSVWQGFVFVNFATTPDQSLDEYLAPVTELIGGYPFSALRKTYGYNAVEHVNWKTLIEAQMEGWHLPYLHKNTLAKTATEKGKRFANAAIKCLGPHGMVSSKPPHAITPSPVGAISARYGVGTFDAFSAGAKVKEKGRAAPSISTMSFRISISAYCEARILLTTCGRLPAIAPSGRSPAITRRRATRASYSRRRSAASVCATPCARMRSPMNRSGG